MDRRTFLLNCTASLTAPCLASAAVSQNLETERRDRHFRIIPYPQFLRRNQGGIFLSNGHILSGSTTKELLAAGLLMDEAKKVTGSEALRRNVGEDQPRGARIFLIDWSHDSRFKTELTSNLSQEDQEFLENDRTGQGYIVRTDSMRERVIVSGSSAMGTLYGATTLVQAWEVKGHRLFLPSIDVKDFPDFRYRAAADWLLFAEINRWAYDWGDGRRAFVKRIKRKLDFCLRYKINMVFFDGFGWHSEKFPGYGFMMRELNQYARERGIKLLFAGYGANTQPSAVLPEHNIGTVWKNRDSYPYGEMYPCFGHEDIPGPYLGTCRANEELNRLKAEEMERFVRDVEPGALYIHREDRGVGTHKEGDPHEDELWRTWKRRDKRCRERWPNDDLLAKDGGAGAVAHGYVSCLNKVRNVKNSDSGYSAAEDCEIIFISPGYNPIPTDHEDWNNHLEFWSNVLSFMPTRENVSIGFREIFLQQGTHKRWVDAYKERLAPLNLNSRMFFFFLGGGDHYLNNYPFVATSVMNGLFKGGDTIYNFSGGVHQEPLQALNAEFSWNTKAPGYRIPTTYEECRSLWEALSDNRETPEQIYGANGFLPLVCQKIYGTNAGVLLSRFTVLFEPQPQQDNAPLVPDLPGKLYPLSVLWGVLSRDETSWDLMISNPRTLRTLQRLKLTPTAWQLRLSRVWSTYENITNRGIELVKQALSSQDLKGETREDVEYLRKCLEVGRRFAGLLNSFHEVLAISGENQQFKLKSAVSRTQEKFNELSRHIDSNFALDTVCPLGGDQGFWIESMEKIRNRLEQLASQIV